MKLEDLPLVDASEVQEGDLLFCTKDSFMQSLLSSVGDPWRHVAMALEIDGELCIGEVTGKNKIKSRPVAKALDFYDRVATARVVGRPAECADRAITFVRDYLNTPQVYAWDDVLLVGLLLTTRRALRADKLDRIVEALEEVAKRAPQAEHPSMTCSAFIYEAFDHGEDCRLSVPFSPMNAGPRTVPPVAPPESMVAALDLQDDELQPILDSYSLRELMIELDRAANPQAGMDFDLERMPELMAQPLGHRGSKVSASQLTRFARIVVDLVDEYSRTYHPHGGDKQEPGELDGRWVSPGDLWRSVDVDDRRYLKRD